MNCVLKHWHPMAGVDIHIMWPPGSPAPTNPAPYYTAQLLVGLFPTVFSKLMPRHPTDGFAISLEQGTDIGSLIPHIGPPSITLPMEIAFSYSKSYFGASRYLSEGKVMACALAICVNTNLNCGTPVPTPTGFVLAITRHIVHMNLGDVLSGIFRMTVDAAIQAVLSWAGGKAGDAIGGAIFRRLRPSTWVNAYCAAANRGLSHEASLFAATKAAVEMGRAASRVSSTLVGFVFGGPLGADMGTLGAPTVGGWGSGLLTGNSDAENPADRVGPVDRWARSAAEGIQPGSGATDYNSGAGAPPVLNP